MIDLKRSARRTGQRIGTKNKRGYLGREDLVVRADNGRYYVREWANGRNMPAVALPLARGAQVPPAYNLAVQIGYDPTGQRVIVGHYTQSAIAQGVPPTQTNMADPQNILIRKDQVLPLRCRPSQNPSRPLYAEVLPDNFVIGSTYYEWAGGDIDLSGEVPSVGNHCYTVVFWRQSTNDLEIASSTPQASATPLDNTDVQEAIDAADTDTIPLKAFVMVAAMTALDGSTNGCTDIRTIINNGSGSGGTVYYQLLRDDGTDKTQRNAINFIDGIGIDITLSDDAENNETDVLVALNQAEVTAAGATLAPANLDIPTSDAPSQTASGRAVWDTINMILTIGTGTVRKLFGFLGTTVGTTLGTAAAGTSVEASRVDHVHAHGTGTVANAHAHADLSGVSANQHHNQSHDHSAAGDGTALAPATFTFPSATSPAQTADGSAVWDSDDDVLTVGDGTSRKTFGKLGSTSPQAVGTAAAGTSVEASRVDHVHSGAKIDLSNLASTAVNADVIPANDDSILLGSSAKKWAEILAHLWTSEEQASGGVATPATGELSGFANSTFHGPAWKDEYGQARMGQLFAGWGALNLTDSALTTPIVSVTVLDDFLGTAGFVHSWAVVYCINNTGGAGQAFTFTYTFGSYTKTRQLSTIGNTQVVIGIIENWTYNNAAANAQRHWSVVKNLNVATAGTYAAFSQNVIMYDTSAVDTSAGNTTVSISGTMSASGMHADGFGMVEGPYR